jgi:hypothetical protein
MSKHRVQLATVALTRYVLLPFQTLLSDFHPSARNKRHFRKREADTTAVSPNYSTIAGIVCHLQAFIWKQSLLASAWPDRGIDRR